MYVYCYLEMHHIHLCIYTYTRCIYWCEYMNTYLSVHTCVLLLLILYTYLCVLYCTFFITYIIFTYKQRHEFMLSRTTLSSLISGAEIVLEGPDEAMRLKHNRGLEKCQLWFIASILNQDKCVLVSFLSCILVSYCDMDTNRPYTIIYAHSCDQNYHTMVCRHTPKRKP